MPTRKVYSATDAQPTVLYAKQVASSQIAYPVLADSAGALITSGLVPKGYDFIALTYSVNNITTAEYRVGGSSGTIVATIALTYVGATANIATITRT